tara:strand:- start:554 stop:1378 length:825 start_codon:yes stop_codon:yes gene_type:complete
MSIITLTSDFGIKDFHVSKIKGLLNIELDNPKVIDISHEISPFNIIEGAYVVKNAYKNFPRGSIHIISIDAEENPEQSHLVVYMDEHFFICADNGITSLISNNIKPTSIYKININNSNNLSAINTFVKVASHIYRGGSLNLIGKSIDKIKQLTDLRIIEKSNSELMCSVIYVDNYGNVITNMTKDFFTKYSNSRRFTIYARNIKFDKIFDSYSEAIDFTKEKKFREEDGKKIALFNSSGHLELSIYKSNPITSGGASSLFGLSYGDNISIIFDN